MPLGKCYASIRSVEVLTLGRNSFSNGVQTLWMPAPPSRNQTAMFHWRSCSTMLIYESRGGLLRAGSDPEPVTGPGDLAELLWWNTTFCWLLRPSLPFKVWSLNTFRKTCEWPNCCFCQWKCWPALTSLFIRKPLDYIHILFSFCKNITKVIWL